MEQYSQYLMSVKSNNNSILLMNNNPYSSHYYSSWEEQAFAEDARGPLGGFAWPPRSYSCSFCRREFRSAQALGGHMNVHRREKAKLKQTHVNNGDTTAIITTNNIATKKHNNNNKQSLCKKTLDPPAAGLTRSPSSSRPTALLAHQESLDSVSDAKSSCVYDDDFVVAVHGSNGHTDDETKLLLGFDLDYSCSNAAAGNSCCKRQKTAGANKPSASMDGLDLELRLPGYLAS